MLKPHLRYSEGSARARVRRWAARRARPGRARGSSRRQGASREGQERVQAELHWVLASKNTLRVPWVAGRLVGLGRGRIARARASARRELRATPTRGGRCLRAQRGHGSATTGSSCDRCRSVDETAPAVLETLRDERPEASRLSRASTSRRGEELSSPALHATEQRRRRLSMASPSVPAPAPAQKKCASCEPALPTDSCSAGPAPETARTDTFPSPSPALPFVYQFAAGAIAGVTELLCLYPLGTPRPRASLLPLANRPHLPAQMSCVRRVELRLALHALRRLRSKSPCPPLGQDSDAAPDRQARCRRGALQRHGRLLQEDHRQGRVGLGVRRLLLW